MLRKKMPVFLSKENNQLVQTVLSLRSQIKENRQSNPDQAYKDYKTIIKILSSKTKSSVYMENPLLQEALLASLYNTGEYYSVMRNKHPKALSYYQEGAKYLQDILSQPAKTQTEIDVKIFSALCAREAAYYLAACNISHRTINIHYQESAELAVTGFLAHPDESILLYPTTSHIKAILEQIKNMPSKEGFTTLKLESKTGNSENINQAFNELLLCLDNLTSLESLALIDLSPTNTASFKSALSHFVQLPALKSIKTTWNINEEEAYALLDFIKDNKHITTFECQFKNNVCAFLKVDIEAALNINKKQQSERQTALHAFTLIQFLAEERVKFKESQDFDTTQNKVIRFFDIAKKLPYDLHRELCARMGNNKLKITEQQLDPYIEETNKYYGLNLRRSINK